MIVMFFVYKKEGERMKSALQVAQYVVNKCTMDGYPISNLQLQKILYYIQKEFLYRDSALFEDDFCAWKFGPVIEEVYYYYCSFGARKIERSYDINTLFDIKEKNIIDDIVEEKRNLNPWEMVEETHKANGAWYHVFNNGLGNGDIIEKELIQERG